MQPSPQLGLAMGPESTPLSHELWGSLLLSPVTASLAHNPVTSVRHLVGDAALEGRGSPAPRAGSHYRGVTHHARTNRFESHIWDEGRQVYLGGFYNEDQAATCYDLAAVRFRGKEAITNFHPQLYGRELAQRALLSQDQVVVLLRGQSKKMNKVVAGAAAGVTMERWELQLTGEKEGLEGVSIYLLA